MSREYDYLIVGGGLAAASAVDGIRDRDADGSIAILSDEAEPPYHRPPLSKEFLRTPDVPRSLLHVKPEGWFEEEAGADLLLGMTATGLDAGARTVTTSDGSELRGRRILLATGGRPRALDVPGSDRSGVFTLRAVEDAEAIRRAAHDAGEAVLVGAGFIGMELAASLHRYGVRSTVVERENRVWSRMLPPDLSPWLQERFEERGVRFRLGAGIREFGGSDGALESVVLEDGSELPCRLAVVGVGIAPNTGLAAGAALEVRDGIVVDGRAESSAPGIYAAGDVARFRDPVFGDEVRVEHWDHARAHGRHAGRGMAGEGDDFDHVSYFFSDVFDLSLNVFGRTARADRIAVEGDLASGRGIVFCESGGRLAGTILVNESEAMEECRERVRRLPPFEEAVGGENSPSAAG